MTGVGETTLSLVSMVRARGSNSGQSVQCEQRGGDTR
jgi:hypothetical protein